MILTTRELPARREHDHYPTDAETVRKVWDQIEARPGGGWRRPDPYVLDPGAGSGVWGQEGRQRYPDAHIQGFEIRPVEKAEGYSSWITDDFLAPGYWASYAYDLIVGNPPYRHAEEFVRISAELLLPGGEIWFLMRLAFLEGQKRAVGLYRDLPPQTVYVCSKRPSFQEDGKSNATAFAVFRWVQGYQGPTSIAWL